MPQYPGRNVCDLSLCKGIYRKGEVIYLLSLADSGQEFVCLFEVIYKSSGSQAALQVLKDIKDIKVCLSVSTSSVCPN
jgi:hypothetical protein